MGRLFLDSTSTYSSLQSNTNRHPKRYWYGRHSDSFFLIWEDSKAYVRDILLKIAWSGLREMSPSAFFFATAFFYNTSTQISIMGKFILYLDILPNPLVPVSTGAQTLEEATCQWVRENRNTWKNWILPMEDIPGMKTNLVVFPPNAIFRMVRF